MSIDGMKENGKHNSVMVIDDDADDRQIFCDAIADADNNLLCHEESSGKAGIASLLKLQESKPSLIFLDVNMPILDGWETLKIIKANEILGDVPVIMCSTAEIPTQLRIIFQSKVLFFWTKPDTYSQMVKILRVILSNDIADIRKCVKGLRGVYLG